MIKNQLFLKKPWMFTVMTAVGGFFGILYANNSGLAFGFVANAAMFIAILVIFNTLFFLALRRTRNQPRPKT